MGVLNKYEEKYAPVYYYLILCTILIQIIFTTYKKYMSIFYIIRNTIYLGGIDDTD